MANTFPPIGATMITVTDMMDMAKNDEFPVTPATMIRIIDQVVEKGYTALEILMDIINWHPAVFDESVMKRLRQAHDQDGLHLTSHLPFHNLNMTTHVEEVRKGTAQNILKAIRHVADLPIETFVLHVTGAVRQKHVLDKELPGEAIEFMKDDIISQGNRTIEDVLIAVDNKRLIIENLPSVPLEFAKIWAREWDLGFCMDIGHVLLRNNDLHQTIDELKAEFPIREYHVHDVIENELGKRKDHKPLGTGLIDFGALAQQVYADDPAPIVILETALESSMKSLPVWQEKIAQL